MVAVFVSSYIFIYIFFPEKICNLIETSVYCREKKRSLALCGNASFRKEKEEKKNRNYAFG